MQKFSRAMYITLVSSFFDQVKPNLKSICARKRKKKKKIILTYIEMYASVFAYKCICVYVLVSLTLTEI